MSVRQRYFIHGVLVHASISSLIQDYYGKEGFIQLCRDHWVSGRVSVPVAVVVLLGVYVSHFVYVVARKKRKPKWPEKYHPMNWPAPKPPLPPSEPS